MGPIYALWQIYLALLAMRSPTFLNSVVVRRGTVTTVIMANMLQAEVIYVTSDQEVLGGNLKLALALLTSGTLPTTLLPALALTARDLAEQSTAPTNLDFGDICYCSII